MTAIISVLGFAVTSIFAAVLLSGALSGLITLGLVELFLRNTLQRGVVADTFKIGFDSLGPNDTPSSNALTRFLNEKYQAPAPPQGTPPPGFSDAAIAGYAERLQAAGSESEVLPNLLGLPGKTLYRLHYRQLCGQIMAAVSRETIVAGDRQVFTPVIDMLSYLSASRKSVFDGSRQIMAGPPPVQPTGLGNPADFAAAERLRMDVDRATREIDQLQAAMSERIGRYAFWYSFFIWVFAFVLIGYSARGSLDFSTDTSWLIARIAGNVVATVIATILGFVLAFASAVVASIVFAWLDRGFSAK